MALLAMVVSYGTAAGFGSLKPEAFREFIDLLVGGRVWGAKGGRDSVGDARTAGLTVEDA